MAYISKTWADRISENPRRRRLTNVNTSEVLTVDVERYEGTILEQGDPFSAANMNDFESRVQNGFTESYYVEKGFGGQTTAFNSDGSITTTYPDGNYSIQTFPADAIVVDTLYDSDGNVLRIKTVIEDNGNIVETITTA